MSQQRGMLYQLIDHIVNEDMLQPAYSCMCQIIDVFIAASIRTPLGSFNGSLASVSAIKLGSIAVEGE